MRSAEPSLWRAPNGNGRIGRETFNWTSTIRGNLINDFNYSHSLDEVFIGVFTESWHAQPNPRGRQLPVYIPGREGARGQDTDGQRRNFSGFDGSPYPASSAGPIHTFANTTTLVKGRHTFKAGVVFEYSGEDDFDQINVNAIPGGTNNQNGQFAFNNSGTARSGLAMADMALGLFD